MWTGPLHTAEREFLRSDLDPRELAALLEPFTDPRPATLLEVREALLSGAVARQVRDAVWRRVITDARLSEEWMVAAIGLAVPGLKACARRLCEGLDGRAAEDVQGEVLAGFIAAVHEIDTGWYRLPWMLRCRAQRAGLRARRDALAHPVAGAGPERGALAPRPPGSPDLVLRDAVRQGVLSESEVYVIGLTRLEGVPLARLARERGTAYWKLAKRRSRAEKRLADAVRSGRVAARSPVPAPA
ncbi:hypothetical protein ABZ234_11975 [Nocardiopsis sp. NPDC006198]|uniref:hypothetical protein n=1 Tax=Nocardiopsis sp. NPDC006198 TaxID=3154472 RepID=UPI0033B96324